MAGWMPDQVFDYVFMPLQEQLEPLMERLAVLEERTRHFDEMEEKMRRFDEMEEKLRRLESLEAQMVEVQASLQKALGTFMPRVEQLLSGLEDQTSSAAATKGMAVPATVSSPQSVPTPTTQHTSQGSLSMIEAARTGDTHAILRLIDCGGDLEQEDLLCETALMHAARGGHSEIIEVLLQAGADIEAYNEPHMESSLILAANAGNVEVVTVLLEHGAGVETEDAQRHTALWHAATKGHTAVVELLLRWGATVDFGEDDVLETAAQHGHPEVVSLLLSLRNDWVDEDLEEALSVTHSAAVVWVVARASPHDFWSQTGGRAVMNATRHDHADALQAMLQAGAACTYRNMNGLTPLHVAASYENTAAMLSLLIHGADTQARDNKGRTPLHLAAIHGREKAVRVLLAKNADRNAMDKRGKIPAHVTTDEGIRSLLGCESFT